MFQEVLLQKCVVSFILLLKFLYFKDAKYIENLTAGSQHMTQVCANGAKSLILQKWDQHYDHLAMKHANWHFTQSTSEVHLL